MVVVVVVVVVVPVADERESEEEVIILEGLVMILFLSFRTTKSSMLGFVNPERQVPDSR